MYHHGAHMLLIMYKLCSFALLTPMHFIRSSHSDQPQIPIVQLLGPKLFQLHEKAGHGHGAWILWNIETLIFVFKNTAGRGCK